MNPWYYIFSVVAMFLLTVDKDDSTLTLIHKFILSFLFGWAYIPYKIVEKILKG